MPNYNDRNLLRYEDAIRLHFDTTGEFAWLTLKNYGFVFGTEPAYAVRMVTVGVPAAENGALPEAEQDRKLLLTRGLNDGEFKPYPQTISISARFDAIDVIKLQVAILTITSKYRITNIFTRRAIIFDVIGKAVERLLQRSYKQTYWDNDKNFFKNTDDNLGRILNKPPGAPQVWQAIQDYRPDNVGLTAYFPEPSLILQEERTRKKMLVNPPLGKTWNTDTRDIQPILFDMREASQPEFDYIIKKVDTHIKAKTGSKEAIPGTLHIQIDRINCYGFRGDSRDLQQLKDANGMLPGVTRTDHRVDKYKDRALDIDTTLSEGADDLWAEYDHLFEGSEEALSEASRKYLKAIMKHDIMHLGVFTGEKDFRGYVSATKSTALAKCFANHYEEVETNLTTYCYAVRCRGGYHLPSTVPADCKKDPVPYLKVLHSFVAYAEQEVTVPGAIWWPDIVGMRVITCNKDCQFFSGPVFLQDHLMAEDNDSFSTLFELLSGKSQGKSPKTSNGDMIAKSYSEKKPPFACLTAGLATTGSNSMSPAAASGPLLHLSTTKLTFGRQPLGTSSAVQKVRLTNLGGELLSIGQPKLIGENPDSFSYVKPGRYRLEKGLSQTISVVFEPKPPLNYNKRSPKRPVTDAPDLDERTATLEIKTSTVPAGKDATVIPTWQDATVSVHTVSLTGTVARAVEPWSVAAKGLTVSDQGVKTITFSDQALNTISAVLRLAVINNNSAQKEVPIAVEVDGDFKVDGDYKDPTRPHASYTIIVTFEPKKIGKCTGTLTITPHDADPLRLDLLGTGAEAQKRLELSANRLSFANQGVGTDSAPQYGTLTNTGNAPLTVKPVITGEHKDDFSWQTTDTEQTVYGGEVRRISVTFRPTKAGKRTAQLDIYSDVQDTPDVVSLVGMGVMAAQSPNSLTFASRKPGNRSAEKDVTFTNLSQSDLTITKITFSGDNDFHQTEELNLPYGVGAGQSCKISVAFKPIKAGKRTGTLTVEYKHSTGWALKLTVSLTGTGSEQDV